MATIIKDLGVVTAYAYAVLGGYTGTEEEFTELLGNIAIDLSQIENLQVVVNGLPAGESPTASYSNGVLTLGIPKGDKGDGIAHVSITTLAAGSQATASYDATTETLSLGIPRGDKGDTGSTGVGITSITKTSTSGLVDTYTITYTNGDTDTFEVHNGTAEVDDTLTIQGAAADAKKTGDEISDLKSAINSVVKNYDHLSPYLYKKNNWINDSGEDATLSGYDTYKIPCSAGDIIRFSWSSLSNAPWGTSFNNGKAIKIESTTNTYTNILETTSSTGRIRLQNKEAILIAPSDSAYVTLVILAENVSAVKVERNTPFPNLVDDMSLKLFDSIYKVDSDNAITTQFYWNYSNGNVDVMGDTVKVLVLKVKQGDIFIFGSIPTGTSYRGAFRASDGTVTQIGTIIASPFVYTVPSDGVLCVFFPASGTSDTIRNPKKQIVLDAKNIENLPFENQYNGLNGVAFGTSLTYNSSIGNGYLNTLTVLSGMTIDNQGVGSSVIKGDGGSLDMLAKIKAYASYSDKRVCILEGFVNDWYGQNALGTYKDTTEDTVCGCVRSALNYMLTQNANMTVCLILDHYGKDYNSLDCSSTAVRGDKTQYEYYEEIAKVAESLGVPVIKEYALSGISELMPQYLADNIHLNALGATQSGNVIWKEMFSHAVNAK